MHNSRQAAWQTTAFDLKSVTGKTLSNSTNQDTSSAHLRSLRKSGAPTRPRRQLVSPRGFSLNSVWHSPPLHPSLPISPWARYGESDDGVLEQLLQGRLRQQRWEPSIPPRHHHTSELKASWTGSYVQHRHSMWCHNNNICKNWLNRNMETWCNQF